MSKQKHNIIIYQQKYFWLHKKKHKNTLAQFQICNQKDHMLSNGSMKYLYRIENTFGSIRGSIKIALHSLQCEIVTTLCIETEPYNPYLSEKKPQNEKYITYLNAFVP